MNTEPIFIHSLFRSGSTYLFNAFRRSGRGYWCYQEPLNEHVRHVRDAPERLLDITSDSADLGHPALDKPYFWELFELRDHIAPLFRKEFSYDWFFIDEHYGTFPDLVTYLRCLIDQAKGWPVLQCCRSFGRVAALRKTFQGAHIHLWRNPWDQWWSYRIGDYFDATTLLILNAQPLPAVLAEVKRACNIGEFHDSDIDTEIANAIDHRLPAKESYFAFYALWLFSLLETEKTAQISLNIDSLSSSAGYRERTLEALTDLGIVALDFSDCEIAQAKFGDRDHAFFADIEDRVQDIFVQHGYSKQALDASLELSDRHKPTPGGALGGRQDNTVHLRQIVLRHQDQLAAAQRSLRERTAAFAASQIAQEEQLAHARAQAADAERELKAQRELNATLEQRLATTWVQVEKQSRELAASRDRIQLLEDMWKRDKETIDELQKQTTHWATAADALTGELRATHASRSWRLTAPLRKVSAYVKEIKRARKAG